MKRPKQCHFMSQRDQTTSFWSDLQKTGTFVPSILDAGRKKRKNEEEEEEDLRKMTYLHGGTLVESFSPQGRRAYSIFRALA